MSYPSVPSNPDISNVVQGFQQDDTLYTLTSLNSFTQQRIMDAIDPVVGKYLGMIILKKNSRNFSIYFYLNVMLTKNMNIQNYFLGLASHRLVRYELSVDLSGSTSVTSISMSLFGPKPAKTNFFVLSSVSSITFDSFLKASASRGVL